MRNNLASDELTQHLRLYILSGNDSFAAPQQPDFSTAFPCILFFLLELEIRLRPWSPHCLVDAVQESWLWKEMIPVFCTWPAQLQLECLSNVNEMHPART